MALMFPWATKEYLLWEMSLGQLVMYHNLGIEQKYPRPDAGKPSLQNMSAAEAKAAREAAKLAMEQEASDAVKQKYRDKYGAI